MRSGKRSVRIPPCRHTLWTRRTIERPVQEIGSERAKNPQQCKPEYQTPPGGLVTPGVCGCQRGCRQGKRGYALECQPSGMQRIPARRCQPASPLRISFDPPEFPALPLQMIMEPCRQRIADVCADEFNVIVVKNVMAAEHIGQQGDN